MTPGPLRYRKRPVEIEAFRWLREDWPEWFSEALRDGRVWSIRYGNVRSVKISTPEGVMKAGDGDYIIRGVKGEIYPCKADIFEMTYERSE